MMLRNQQGRFIVISYNSVRLVAKTVEFHLAWSNDYMRKGESTGSVECFHFKSTGRADSFVASSRVYAVLSLSTNPQRSLLR